MVARAALRGVGCGSSSAPARRQRAAGGSAGSKASVGLDADGRRRGAVHRAPMRRSARHISSRAMPRPTRSTTPAGSSGTSSTASSVDTRGDPADAVPAVRQMYASTSNLALVIGCTSDEAASVVPIFTANKTVSFCMTGQSEFDHVQVPVLLPPRPAGPLGVLRDGRDREHDATTSGSRSRSATTSARRRSSSRRSRRSRRPARRSSPTRRSTSTRPRSGRRRRRSPRPSRT